jgi:transcription initiation factor IIE alpha subunit
MLWVQIGQTAGMVYRFLEKKGEASTTEILKEVKVPSDVLYMALGWLAREDRIKFDRVRKTLKVSLK